MDIANWNQTAVQRLLADTDRVLALTDLDDVRGGREIVDHTIANAQQNFIDLARRRRPLTLEDADEATFRGAMDHIQARIRYFGSPAHSHPA